MFTIVKLVMLIIKAYINNPRLPCPVLELFLGTQSSYLYEQTILDANAKIDN
jgi:hypothetical protein